MRRRSLQILMLLLATCCAAGRVAADSLVTYRFDGIVTSSEVYNVADGDAIVGEYTFDRTATDSGLAGPNTAQYENAVDDLWVSVSDRHYLTSDSASIFVRHSGYGDFYGVETFELQSNPAYQTGSFPLFL
jgi:hypothetical protein